MSREWGKQGISLVWSTLSGILLISIFPLWGKSGLAWVALLPLLWLVCTTEGRGLFWYGWWTGIVFFSGLLYWLSGTMVRYGGLPLILSRLSLLLLCLYLGLYVASFSVLLRYALRRTRVPFSILAPTLWVALEWVRSYLLTGFPWGLLGYSQARSAVFVQCADLAGVYGISFLIVFVNAALADIIRWYVSPGPGERAQRRIVRETLALGLVITIAAGYGLFRLHTPVFPAPGSGATGGPLAVALIQGNIPQEMKRDVAQSYTILAEYGRMSMALPDRPGRLVIWPETACNATALPGEGTTFSVVSGWAQRIGSPLLLGCPRYALDREGAFNSAFLLSPTGELTGFYDKMHLVPFGEYFPFQWVADALGGMGSFLRGNDVTVFPIQGRFFSVIICFEAIFPDLCRRFVREGADFLVNLTNDAWFGDTAAPYQHFDMACMRAVENRVWLARAANTGISAIVDPWGRVVRRGGIFERLVIEGEIGANPPSSLYVGIGDLFAWVCLFFSFVWCVMIIHKGLKGA
ncbi:MAG: apolipoprotein N-acyltransferase [bacterium]